MSIEEKVDIPMLVRPRLVRRRTADNRIMSSTLNKLESLENSENMKYTKYSQSRYPAVPQSRCPAVKQSQLSRYPAVPQSQFHARDIQHDSKWDSLPTWNFSSDSQTVKSKSPTDKKENDVLEVSGLMSARCSGYILGRCKLMCKFTLRKECL